MQVFAVAGSDGVFEFSELERDQGIVSPRNQLVHVQLVLFQMRVPLPIHISVAVLFCVFFYMAGGAGDGENEANDDDDDDIDDVVDNGDNDGFYGAIESVLFVCVLICWR